MDGYGRDEVKNSNSGGMDPGRPMSLSFSRIKRTMLHISKNIWPEDKSRDLSCIRKDAYTNLTTVSKM